MPAFLWRGAPRTQISFASGLTLVFFLFNYGFLGASTSPPHTPGRGGEVATLFLPPSLVNNFSFDPFYWEPSAYLRRLSVRKGEESGNAWVNYDPSLLARMVDGTVRTECAKQLKMADEELDKYHSENSLSRVTGQNFVDALPARQYLCLETELGQFVYVASNIAEYISLDSHGKCPRDGGPGTGSSPVSSVVSQLEFFSIAAWYSNHMRTETAFDDADLLARPSAPRKEGFTALAAAFQATDRFSEFLQSLSEKSGPDPFGSPLPHVSVKGAAVRGFPVRNLSPDPATPPTASPEPRPAPPVSDAALSPVLASPSTPPSTVSPAGLPSVLASPPPTVLRLRLPADSPPASPTELVTATTGGAAAIAVEPPNVDLSNQGLTSLTDMYDRYPGVDWDEVKVLDLSNNEITAVTREEMARLTGLRELNLRNNRLTSFPEGCPAAFRLQHLDVSNDVCGVGNRISLFSAGLFLQPLSDGRVRRSRLRTINLAGAVCHAHSEVVDWAPFGDLVGTQLKLCAADIWRRRPEIQAAFPRLGDRPGVYEGNFHEVLTQFVGHADSTTETILEAIKTAGEISLLGGEVVGPDWSAVSLSLGRMSCERCARVHGNNNAVLTSLGLTASLI